MADHSASANIISDGKNYIVIKGSFMKLAKLRTQKQCQLGKIAVDVAGLLGRPVGSQFRLQPGKGRQRLLQAELVERAEDLADDIAAEESVRDNRHLVANPDSQALTREHIHELLDQGATGRQIVTSIVDNSTSFQGKTEYSQEKYVRKKQKKYFEFISVHEPTARLVANMYYMQDPLKIMNLRLDSLSQLLTALSVRSGGRYLVLETGCLAVAVAALLERLGGAGHLVHIYHSAHPQRHAVDAINFSEAQLSCLSCLDLATLTARCPSDGGVPAPVADVPAPAADVPTPVADVPTPAADVPTPVADVPAPAADVPTPVADVPTPAADVPAPAADVPTPVADVPAPAADVPTPVADVPAPTADVPAPVADVPAPAADVPAPAADVPAPVSGAPLCVKTLSVASAATVKSAPGEATAESDGTALVTALESTATAESVTSAATAENVPSAATADYVPSLELAEKVHNVATAGSAPSAATPESMPGAVGDGVVDHTEDPLDPDTQLTANGVAGAAHPGRKRRHSEEPTGNATKRSKYCRSRDEDAALAIRLLSERRMDGLLICCRQHPLNLLRYLTEFLAVSRPFAVFCPYKEPLLDCYFAMKTKGYIMLRLTETWLRNYQVLPERTHPEINMSGGGGYLLTGYKVDRSLDAANTD